MTFLVYLYLTTCEKLNMNNITRFTLTVSALLLLVPLARGAESGNASVLRSEANRMAGKRTSPKYDPSTPEPSALTAGSSISPAGSAGRRNESLEGSGEDERSSALPAALPNTMDGLNDKRPLGIGDRLSFKVVEDEIAPRPLIVTDSLEIDVPYAGRVPIGNRTCKQFAYYVKQLLEKDYYYQATVLVGLDSAGGGSRAFSRGKVYIMGLVRSPGAMEIPVSETLTVTKAIIRAGGFAPYANKKNVKLIRSGKNGVANKPIIVNCAEILEKGLWDKDVELHPEDIVQVREKPFNFF